MIDRSNSEWLRGFGDRQTNRLMDICDSRVAFATENFSANLDKLEHAKRCENVKILG